MICRNTECKHYGEFSTCNLDAVDGVEIDAEGKCIWSYKGEENEL